MTKEPPILVVNKPRQTTTRSRKAAPARRREAAPRKGNAKRGRKKKGGERKRNFPSWAYYLMMGAVGVILLAGFYYFFIRPYAYRWKPCYGTKAYGVCLPYGYSVHGFDISHHQGRIDWEKLRGVQQAPFPVRFVFMKASEGGDFSDTAFVRNFDEARRVGFIRGAYHFYNPKTSPERQADFFIRSVKLEPGDLPPVLDIETRPADARKLRADLKKWLDRVERHYGVKPILYTSYKYKTRYLNDSLFNSYPYWIAHYYVDSVAYEGEWKFWQHTDVGTLPGIDNQVDLNVFNGTMAEMDSLRIKPVITDRTGQTDPCLLPKNP